MLSPRTKFPLKLLSNLAWGVGGRTGVQMGKQGKGVCVCVIADLQHPKMLREVFSGPKTGQPSCPQALFHPSRLRHGLQPGTRYPVSFCKINILCL